MILILESQLAHSVWVSGVLLPTLIDSFLLCSHCLHSLFPFGVFFSFDLDAAHLFLREEVVCPVSEAVEAWGMIILDLIIVVDMAIVIESAGVLGVLCVSWLARWEPLSRSKGAWDQGEWFIGLN